MPPLPATTTCLLAPRATGVLAPPEPPARRARPPRERTTPPPRPPDDGGIDEGGGGGSGWNGDPDPAPAGGGRPEEGHGAFALALALSGIATFFLVVLVVGLLLRRGASDWAARSIDAPPGGLWISTGLLLASSVTLARAVHWARRGAVPALRRSLAVTLLLGIGFLAVQALVWWNLVNAGFSPSESGYGAVFYCLTGLHALHVVGGLGFLATLTLGSLRSAAQRVRPHSVRHCAIYWHFMGGLWVVLFAVLYYVTWP